MRNDAATYQSYANAAFLGADFHLHTIKNILKDPHMQHDTESDAIDERTRQEIQSLHSAIAWYTRSFFWEMIAVFDTLLRWANARYGLGASSFYDFRWRGDTRKPGLFDAIAERDSDEWAAKRHIIDGIWQEQ